MITRGAQDPATVIVWIDETEFPQESVAIHVRRITPAPEQESSVAASE
jgi:hypothetical protein